jgi:myo-inositol-1(or 4)-monophosphatase
MKAMLELAVEASRQAGQLLRSRAGSPDIGTSTKRDQYNVVTRADHESEAVLIEAVRTCFPDHSVLSEEAGLDVRDPQHMWVIDPLDGTSNFAAGLPWFGVLMAHLLDGVPDVAVMYLPCSEELYVAERGRGALKNGVPVRVSDAPSLEQVLWACAMDDPGTGQSAEKKLAVLHRILQRTRNVRTTNCLLDAAYSADGRLGGMLNWSCKIWDVAAPWLVVREAGGEYTTVDGEAIEFDVSPAALERHYAVLAGARHLHATMREVIANAEPER